MAILESIGLNGTILIQFTIFFVTFIFVNGLVFKPYNKAYEARIKKTEGNKDLAEDTLEETKSLELEYQKKAQVINREFKTIYDSSKTEALHEYDELVTKAREKAQSILETNRAKIAQEVEEAQTALGKEIPEVGAVIATKLLGKEVKI